MTHPEARRRAVEAAASWLAYEMSWSQNEAQYFVEGVLTAAERAMADAGWRMVRVPDALPVSDMVTVPKNLTADAIAHISAVGWNACRAKMLEDEG